MTPATRSLMEVFVAAALRAVDPEAAVTRALGGLDLAPTLVVATGKAAPAMARGAATALGPIGGTVVSDHPEEIPDGMELVVAGHPIPNEESAIAGRKVLESVNDLGAEDTLLYLISGGTSALVEVPTAGISLFDIQVTTELLLRSGASIDQVNTVRIALSEIKGGGLARAANPAGVTTLAISDVLGDRPALIGSGPSVPSATSTPKAWDVIERYGLAGELPAAVTARLRQPTDPSETEVEQGEYQIVANGALAAQAVVDAGAEMGLAVKIVTTDLKGEARDQAAGAIEHARRSSEANVDAWVYAGETTVTVTGDGVGGRNQEAALAAAIDLAGSDDLVFLAFGTDGIDGPTDAAGAIVDGATIRAEGADRLDASDHLNRNDSATWLAAAGAQMVTGPTGTNVGDLWVVLRHAGSSGLQAVKADG